MKIKVNTISDEGWDCIHAYDPQELDLETEDIKFLEFPQAAYHVTKESNDLFVAAKIQLRLKTFCVRCLDKIEHNLDKECFFHYKVKDSDTVDTTDDLRQEIILSYPLKPLCSSDCLGLCVKCGENLNKGKCNC